MARTGPVTKDTSTVALGLAKIMVGKSNPTTNAKAVTFSAATNTITAATHGFAVHDPVTFTTTGVLPSGIVAATRYYVIPADFAAGEFKISAKKNGTVLSLGTDGTPTTTCHRDTNIDKDTPILDEAFDSLGALNTSSFTSNVEYWKLESGFPRLEDMTIPLSETAQLECEFKEVHPRNLAYARGVDASGAEFDDNHSGEINLGTMVAPAFVRVEAVYTYPNGTNKMAIIFPRANVTSSVNLNFAAEDNANVPITIESKRADSEVSGGHSTWDNAPLGRILFT
jgi:hypothetical protein